MREPLPSTDADALWCAAGRWVEAELGLHYPRRLWPDLVRGLETAARRLDLPDAASCAQRALTYGLGARQKQVLAECLTIGETYFFRDPQLFERLAAQVLQPLIAARAGGTRELRLWSAGCASGEEPYSLAMLVAGLLPDWRQWKISILATDINPAALQKGRAAAYGAWSFRGELPASTRPFFREGADGRQHVDPALRRLVRFAPLNLASNDYPSVQTMTSGMDLILCRNVLIYFEVARVTAVLGRLGRALAHDGWLVTGSAELPRGGIEGLRVVHADGLFGLRRADPHAAARPTEAPAPARSPVEPMLPVLRSLPHAPPVPRAPASSPAPAATTGPADEPDDELLQRARGLADSGDLVGAERLCRKAVDRDKLDPGATYLLASILLEAGEREQAAVALQRTLYLDPDHLLAGFALGSLTLRHGQEQAGRRHLARALAQLARLPAEEVLEGSGGLTARGLEGAIRRAGGGAP
jgi:chemotaxis protein methyltransferase CheR